MDLTPAIKFNEMTLHSDHRIVKDLNLLPRSKLAQNQVLFEKFLNVVKLSSGDEMDGLLKLLIGLPTNEHLEGQILENQDFDSIFGLSEQGFKEDTNLYKILYSLQIIQSLILNHKNRPEQLMNLYIE